MDTVPTTAPARPTLGEAFKYWRKLGFISFGGPAGQISMMHQELVEKRRWISEHRYLHALNYCMLLPGPEATQLAIYISWLMHGIRGGIIAGVLFFLPSFLLLSLLAGLYLAYGNLPWVQGIFYGIRPAVVAVVLFAAWRIGSRALKNEVLWGMAALAFIGIFFFDIAFPWIVLAAGLLGAIGGVPDLYDMGEFFTKAAFLTIGGAYAVLPYVYQGGVEHFQWLTGPQMMDGLALGEATPGPLIMVVTWVGYLGGVAKGVFDNPVAAGLAGAAVATFFTFLPSFLFILAGGPLVEATRGEIRFTAPLTGITAAVVGVILNLAAFFAWHTFWPQGTAEAPFAGRFDWLPVIVAVASFVALWKYKADIMKVIGVCALVGLAYSFLM